MITIQNHAKSRDILQHVHRCNNINTTNRKLQINFDQTMDCCPRDGNGHPDEFDCALKRYHQQNVSCGYILPKVKQQIDFRFLNFISPKTYSN